MYALREEGDMGLFVPIFDDVRFLSTPSARRATGEPSPFRPPAMYFYPRPPRGGRPVFSLIV